MHVMMYCCLKASLHTIHNIDSQVIFRPILECNEALASGCARGEPFYASKTIQCQKRGSQPILLQAAAPSPAIKAKAIAICWACRPQMALKYAMLSLFSLHNETFNTWSHLAGGVHTGALPALAFPVC